MRSARKTGGCGEAQESKVTIDLESVAMNDVKITLNRQCAFHTRKLNRESRFFARKKVLKNSINILIAP